jgi:hypothetical protein
VAIVSDNLAQIAARLSRSPPMLRLGTGRLGAIETANRLKPNGEFIWNRDAPNKGNPDDTVASFTTQRD